MTAQVIPFPRKPRMRYYNAIIQHLDSNAKCNLAVFAVDEKAAQLCILKALVSLKMDECYCIMDIVEAQFNV